MAIIAILAAIAVPNFFEAQVRSKVSRTKSDMRTVGTAINAYIVDYNDVPPLSSGGVAAGFLMAQPYLSEFPSLMFSPILRFDGDFYDPSNGTVSSGDLYYTDKRGFEGFWQ